MVKFSTTNCPCHKESLCEPLTVKVKHEVFGFSINGKKNFDNYNWDKLTAVVVFGDWSDDLLCKAHEKVCEFLFSNAKNCSLHKKWSFPLRISSVIATKSVVSLMENFIFCAVSVWSFWWKKFFFFLQEKLDYRCLTRKEIISLVWRFCWKLKKNLRKKIFAKTNPKYAFRKNICCFPRSNKFALLISQIKVIKFQFPMNNF